MKSDSGGTNHGFFVQARIKKVSDGLMSKPVEIGGVWVVESWKEIRFSHTHPEIGIHNDMMSIPQEQGLLSYAAAKALMAWVASHHRGLEFRLVKAKCVWSCSVEIEGYGDVETYGWEAVLDKTFTPMDKDSVEVADSQPDAKGAGGEV